MPAHAVLRRLRAVGVEVAVEEGGLALDGPADRLTPDVLAFLKEHKAALLAALTCTLCHRSLALHEPECWWGECRAHPGCGEEAWRKEWR